MPSVDPRSERVSDTDRQAVVDRLREASADGLLDLDEFGDRVGLAYRSSTRADLDWLTDDLPRTTPSLPERRPTRWTVGVFSGERRTGPWRPAKPTRAVATFGSCRIDLTNIELDDDDDEVLLRAYAVFGGLEIVVPEGASVELAGFAVFGSKTSRVRGTPQPTAFPVVRIAARAVFGGITVRSHHRRVP